MQPYGLTCDRCDQGTPYFWSYDQMMRWVSNDDLEKILHQRKGF